MDIMELIRKPKARALIRVLIIAAYGVYNATFAVKAEGKARTLYLAVIGVCIIADAFAIASFVKALKTPDPEPEYVEGDAELLDDTAPEELADPNEYTPDKVTGDEQETLNDERNSD